MEEEKKEGESIPIPKAVEESITHNNKFLANFLHVYNYKQKRDLRAAQLKSILHITKNSMAIPDGAYTSFKLLVELEHNGEILILREFTWFAKQEEVDKAAFASKVVDRIHTCYYQLMRHGLATVIRTAQKKGADIII